MARRNPRRDEQVLKLVKAWNNYPAGFRAELMKEWPELYTAVSHLVRSEETFNDHR